MLEFAQLIGERETLLLCDALGGQTLRIASSRPNARIAAAVSDRAAERIQRTYCGEVLQIPVGRAAIAEARRAGVIQACREKALSIQEACLILGTSRTYLSQLVNRPALDAPVARPMLPQPRQTDLFAEDDDAA